MGTDTKQKLSVALKLAWGVGSVGTVSVLTITALLLLFFMTTVLGIEPALAGGLLFGAKLFDAFAAPIMGGISDNWKGRWGRRAPFLMAGSAVCALGVILVFNPPAALAGTPLSGWLLMSLVTIALGYTLFNVPYLAMPAEMTDDYHERSNIMSYRAAFLVGGSFVGSAVAGLLLGAFGSGRFAYEAVSVILGVFVFITMLTAVTGTKRARFTTFVKPTISAKNQLKLVMVNRPFLILGTIKAVQFLQLSAGTAATLFFFVTVLDKTPAALFPFGTAAMAGSLLSLRLWLPIVHRLGKKPALRVGLVYTIVVILSWLLASPQEPMPLFVLRGFLLGSASAGIVLCSQSMITDAIAYDRQISGLNREGLFSSAFSFLEKTMYASGPLIIGAALTIFGFIPDIPKGQPQPDSAIFAITLGQVYIPVACLILIYVLLSFYKLDENMLRDAKRHALGEAEEAPAKGD